MSSGMVTRDRLTAVLLTTVTGGITTETGDARYAGKSATETALAGKAGAPIVRYEGNATTALTTTSSTGAQLHSSMGVSLAANSVYKLDLWLYASGGAAGLKVGIDAPSGADIFAEVAGTLVSGVYDAALVGAVSTLTTIAFAASAAKMIHVTGVLWTGSTAGTVIPRVAAATNGQTVNVLNAGFAVWPLGATS